MAENEALRTENAELKAKVENTTERLFDEIDGNRLREDALVQTIADLSSSSPPKSPSRIPSRPELKSVREEPSIDEEDDFIVDFKGVDERAVRQRAEEFLKAAEPFGGYKDMSFDDLCDMVRNDPGQYLRN